MMHRVLATLMLVTACGDDNPPAMMMPPPSVCGTTSGTGCAPDSARVDLIEPVFSNPTAVTNPLFPAAEVQSVVLLGEEDGEPLRVEVTLLANRKMIDWRGGIEALESQYVAFIDGRIEETALDWFAQADGGAVWYLGEDVFNYSEGVVADMDGTWVAGKDGPGGMIMPADPKVGNVYRPENIPGVVFEEVTVTAVDLTVPGPTGEVQGAISVDELHLEGSHEEKIFAPGYGEFSTGAPPNIEAVALGIPTDALGTPVPVELESIEAAANDVLAALDDWVAIGEARDSIETAWEAFQVNDVPPLLEDQMDTAIEGLNEAITLQSTEDAGQTAIDVIRASLDLQLRHRPQSHVDLDRLDLWVSQALLDAQFEDAGGVKGDVATMEWIDDRITHVDPAAMARIATEIAGLRIAADAEDFAAVTEAAMRLRSELDGLAM